MLAIRRASLALGVAAVLSVAACEAFTSPSSITAAYALVSVAGDAVPARVSSGSELIVIADTIRLREDGTGQRIFVSTSGASGDVERSRDEFTWRAAADTIEISFPCGDMALASCIAPPHLVGRVRTGLQLVLDHAVLYETPAVYNRIGAR